ncbi:hypothetical protein J8L85_05810 [Maribacter sp. MMG018]|uniref:hypothetical protein n=1 Tax=Maribacter sp. MMG018 TaxID=2822688 RepID=UPI001B3963BD|nr:hypothetical protein [Maribacter sp. MMG018]MBQ4913943.1 hypothetical protein [Maribacter sp. MMG018]
MGSDIVDTNGLLLVAKEKLLTDKLVAQVAKDFSLANISLQLPITFEANTFISVIRDRVYRLITEHFSEYLNLLYIIDVPERELENMQVTDAAEIADQVTFLILKREFQKVMYKTLYG